MEKNSFLLLKAAREEGWENDVEVLKEMVADVKIHLNALRVEKNTLVNEEYKLLTDPIKSMANEAELVSIRLRLEEIKRELKEWSPMKRWLNGKIKSLTGKKSK